MQRGNAVKALRSDFSKTEREERLALAASLEDGPGEPLIGGRQSIDPASAASCLLRRHVRERAPVLSTSPMQARYQ